jgi:hypothetical protein
LASRLISDFVLEPIGVSEKGTGDAERLTAPCSEVELIEVVVNQVVSECETSLALVFDRSSLRAELVGGFPKGRSTIVGRMDIGEIYFQIVVTGAEHPPHVTDVATPETEYRVFECGFGVVESSHCFSIAPLK